MAANGTVNGFNGELEPVVNRWVVDYYFSQALEYFKSGQDADFCALKRLIDNVLSRHVENTDTIPTKIKILQFLSLINEDLLVEPESHLESALTVLLDLSEVGEIPHQDFKTVSTSIKEMIVGLLIKNNKFDRGKQVIQKHFPKPMIGKKAIFMGLISQKSNKHEVIEEINFQQFKMEMVTFCQKLFPFSVPFLYKAANQLVDKRCTERSDAAPEAEEQVQPCCRQVVTFQYKPNQCSVIQRTRLEAAYNALAAGTDQETFAELEEEVEKEQEREHLCLQLCPESLRGKDTNSEWNEQFERKTGSPMEASPADQLTQMDVAAETPAGSLSKTPPAVLRSRFPYSVARLVIEPDSQPSSQSTAASQDPEPEVRTETPPQPLVVNNESDPQCPEQDGGATVTTCKRRRLASKTSTRASTSQAASSVDDENLSDSIEVEDVHQKSNLSSKRQSRSKLPDSEEELPVIATSCKTPEQTPRRSVINTPKQNKSDTDDHISDSSLERSPSPDPPSVPAPQKSSTPHKVSDQNKDPAHLKWKALYSNAKESKETWSDEDSDSKAKKKSGSNESVLSHSGHKRRMWTDAETKMLKEGVQRFGEGNWCKIKAYYTFQDRTNVQLKDRWRTMQKLNMV